MPQKVSSFISQQTEEKQVQHPNAKIQEEKDIGNVSLFLPAVNVNTLKY